jgi:carbonic anhydrase/acetyltransferase-like protein (isoleucine patch superfamily)
MKTAGKNAVREPKIAKSAYICKDAHIAGDVTIGENVFVGPHAVIRADELGSKIVIGSGSNVQDGVIIHALTGTTVKVGKNTAISHGVLLHGPCKVGDNCFIGFRSVIFKTNVGDGVYLGIECSLEGAKIPSGVIISSMSNVHDDKAPSFDKVGTAEKKFHKQVIKANLRLAKLYRTGKIKIFDKN